MDPWQTTESDVRDVPASAGLRTVGLLARKRRYSEAARCLAEILAVGGCSEPEALDLQARMYVQQGMHLHAESCWLKAHSLDGTNPRYAGALNRLRKERHPVSRFRGMVIGSGLVGVVLLAWWQLATLGRIVQRNQHAASEAISEIHADVLVVSEFTHKLGEFLSHSLSTLDDRLKGLHSAVSNRLELVPTATALRESQAALIGHLENRLAPLSEAVDEAARDLAVVAASQEGLRAESTGNFARFDNVLTQLRQTVSQTSSTLAALHQGSVAAHRQADEEVDRALADIRQEITRLTSIVKETKASVEAMAASRAPPEADAHLEDSGEEPQPEKVDQ